MAAARRRSSPEAFEYEPTHRPFAIPSTIGAWTECSSSCVSASHSPRCCDRLGVVVIEMRSRREQLDRFEPVCGDVHEVIASQTRLVKEMGGDAEAVLSQTPMFTRARV